MTVIKRDTNNKEEIRPGENLVTEASAEKKAEAPACKSCNSCSIIKYLLTIIITALVVISIFVIYLKQFQPELYSKKVEILLNNSNNNREAVSEQIATATTGYNPDHHKSVNEMKDKLDSEINLDEYDDILNLEEKAFLKEVLKEERILEKLKDRPDLLKVKEYMEEPIGQFVKRFSLEQQVVLFIDSNDERSKITRLAISQAKIPFGIMEVDAEPRKVSIRDALFRMTAQRTFPFIFVNGKFFGNSFALQKAMQNGSFYELVDSEENKANWLADKEDYAKKIEKRRKDNEERKRKKLEKIQKKIEDSNKKQEL